MGLAIIGGSMTIQPGKKNFKVLQGATFEETITWSDENGPVNLTGYTARMQAREEYESATAFIDLTTGNGGITLGGAAGTIVLLLSATATAAITAEHGYYDLELVSASGRVYRLLQGDICISKEATR